MLLAAPGWVPDARSLGDFGLFLIKRRDLRGAQQVAELLRERSLAAPWNIDDAIAHLELSLALNRGIAWRKRNARRELMSLHRELEERENDDVLDDGSALRAYAQLATAYARWGEFGKAAACGELARKYLETAAFDFLYYGATVLEALRVAERAETAAMLANKVLETLIEQIHQPYAVGGSKSFHAAALSLPPAAARPALDRLQPALADTSAFERPLRLADLAVAYHHFSEHEAATACLESAIRVAGAETRWELFEVIARTADLIGERFGTETVVAIPQWLRAIDSWSSSGFRR